MKKIKHKKDTKLCPCSFLKVPQPRANASGAKWAVYYEARDKAREGYHAVVEEYHIMNKKLQCIKPVGGRQGYRDKYGHHTECVLVECGYCPNCKLKRLKLMRYPHTKAMWEIQEENFKIKDRLDLIKHIRENPGDDEEDIY